MLSNRGNETFIQILVVKVVTLNKSLIVRALLDSSSQKSNISKDCAESLSLSLKTEKVHSLFGGDETKATVNNLYEIYLSALQTITKLSNNLLDQN